MRDLFQYLLRYNICIIPFKVLRWFLKITIHLSNHCCCVRCERTIFWISHRAVALPPNTHCFIVLVYGFINTYVQYFGKLNSVVHACDYVSLVLLPVCVTTLTQKILHPTCDLPARTEELVVNYIRLVKAIISLWVSIWIRRCL